MKKIFLSLLIFFFLLTGISSAEFYKWEDEKGNLHITDYPPPSKSVKNLKVHKFDRDSQESEPPAPPTVPPKPRETKLPQAEVKQERSKTAYTEPRKYNNVVLYTTSWCGYCKKAAAFFQSRNIPFTEYDIEKDPAAAERRRRLDSRPGVPLAVINGQTILGFSPGAYENALK